MREHDVMHPDSISSDTRPDALDTGGRLTLDRWITAHAEATPSRPAIVDRGVVISYGELESRAVDLASALGRAGHGRGARIATITGSTTDQVVLLLACAKAGAMLVPLSWRLTAGELAQQLQIADPSLLLVEEDHLPVAEDAVERLGEPALGSTTLGAEGVESSVPPARDPLPTAAPRPEDGLLMLFTSGTTSAPKAVVLTQANCVWVNRSLQGAAPLSSEDVVLQILPQHHVAGWNVQPLLAWQQGAQVVLERTFDAGRALALIERHRATATMGVPTTYRALLQHPHLAERDLSSLRTAIVGGGMLDQRAIEELAARGVELRQGYGLTEAAPNVVLTRDSSDVGTTGRAYPHVELALLIEDTIVHGAGTGELLVRSPAVFPGYFRDPEATAQTMREGWLRTGDLVELDADGRVTIVDRVKDIVRSGAESIAPIEVELALLEHPRVAEAAVAGVPSDRWGEELVAWLVLTAEVGEQELRNHLETRLAGFKHPKQIVVVESIPRTSSGKPLRRVLAASLTGSPTGAPTDRTQV